MGTMFLQEVDATVVLADVRDFAPLAAQLGPVELGIALSRFYDHFGEIVERHHGRIVKFIGDSLGARVEYWAPSSSFDRRLATILAHREANVN